MSDDYLWDRRGDADPDVARLEALLAPLSHDAPLDELHARRRRVPRWVVGGIASVIAAVAAVLALVMVRSDSRASTCRGGEGFAFAGVGGAVTCGGRATAAGRLPVGATLDTGARRASLEIADIGSAELGPETRVRLDRTDTERHQLTLERGQMHAKVVAPPRLFAVMTKHTAIVDLGCEYAIEIDEAGAGHVCVESGLIELATTRDTVVVAPQGTCAQIRAERPGLPVLRDAASAFADAVRAYEADAPGAAEAVLAAATERDALTLVALATTDPLRRLAVLTRLAALAPPADPEITPEAADRDPALLASWRNQVVRSYLVNTAGFAPLSGKPAPRPTGKIP